MNLLKKSLILLFFLTFFFTPLSAQSENKTSVTFTGIQYCDEIFNFLKKNNFNPKAQNLVTKGSNLFPYNIIISNFPDSEDPNNSENLIFVFKLEEIYKYKEILLNTAQKLKEANIKSTILISYDETVFPGIEKSITGSQIFIENLNTNEDNDVFIIDLAEDKNAFVSGSFGITSPSWMIRNVFNAFVQENFAQDLSPYYLSQFSKYKFLNKEILSTFHLNNIHAIKLIFKTEQITSYDNIKKISNVIADVIDEYTNSTKKINDFHSLMFKAFNRTFWFTEYTIVQIIIVTLFIALIILFYTGFLNTNLRLQAWKQIKNNWHIIPATFALLLIGFFSGKGIYNLIDRLNPPNPTAYGILILEISISSALILFLFLLEIFFNKNYGEKSLDILIMITTILNLLVFSIIDISLFPIFLSITLLSIISVILKRNWTHIILFIFMIITFVPYVFTMYTYADSQVLRQFFMHSNLTCFFLPLILLPLYLMLLRIFTAVRKRFTKKRVFFLLTGITYLFFSILFFVGNYLFFTQRVFVNQNPEMTKITDDSISVSYSDKTIFDEIIRTVQIQTEKEPAYLEFIVTGESQPVLYSDNDFEALSKNSSIFLIPSKPGKNLNFSYGTIKMNSTLKIKAFYETDDPITFNFSETELFIGEN